jgi:hypothetical protein
MADKTVPQLDAVIIAAAADVIPISVDGVLKKIGAQDLKTEGVRLAKHNVIIASTTQTINLSTVMSVNVIRVPNPGITLTLQFPTSPVENQVVQFTTLDNTVTLIVGTGGSFSVVPTFAGAPTAGFTITYAYHNEDGEDEWIKIGG